MLPPASRRPRWPLAAAAVVLLLATLSMGRALAGQTPPQPVASDAPAQSSLSDTLTVHSVDASQFPVISAFVRVAGSDGLPRRGLTATAFSVIEEGVAVQPSVEETVDDASELAVVFAIDTSGSMADNGGLVATVEALRRILPGLAAGDRVALLTYAREFVAIDWTTDKAQVVGLLDTLEAEGATALYDATVAAVRLALTSDATERAIVLLTDGEESAGSTNSRDEAISEAARAGIPIHTIALGGQADEDLMRELATVSGGLYLPVFDVDGVGGAFDQILDSLRLGYRLTWTSALPGDGEAHAVVFNATTPLGLAEAAHTVTTRAVAPTITVTRASGPLTSDAPNEVRGTLDIAVHVDAQAAVALVSIEFDGRTLATLDASPFEYTLRTTNMERGDYRLVVRASDVHGNSSATAYTVSVRGSELKIAFLSFMIGATALVAYGYRIAARRRSRRRAVAPAPSLSPPAPAPAPPAVDPNLTVVGALPRATPAPAPVVAPAAASGPAPQMSLRVRAGSLSGESFAITGSATIGSGPDADVQLPNESGAISPLHARVAYDATAGWVIEALGDSAVRVDGLDLQGRTALYEGSVVEIGRHELEFRR